MPNPNSPELKAQRQQVQQKIDEIEKRIQNAPPDHDTTPDQIELGNLKEQMTSLQREQQNYREQNRQQSGQGRGRASAPGQQKKKR